MSGMTPTEALDKLATEGEADQIAAFLAEQGHTGNHEAPSCPVSNYVYATTGERISVAPSIWQREDGRGPVSRVPEPVTRFVMRFDARRYPDLIAGVTHD